MGHTKTPADLLVLAPHHQERHHVALALGQAQLSVPSISLVALSHTGYVV
jgi:hypothetical protein